MRRPWLTRGCYAMVGYRQLITLLNLISIHVPLSCKI